MKALETAMTIIQQPLLMMMGHLIPLIIEVCLILTILLTVYMEIILGSIFM